MIPVAERRKSGNVLPSTTHRIRTGCGGMVITVCWDNRRETKGIRDLMITLGKSGTCAGAQTQTIARLLSAALRTGLAPDVLADELLGIRCSSPGLENGEEVLSCADAIGKFLKVFAATSRKEVIASRTP